jgi:mannose-6-phosphate isomerase-like protein (cupin superfamily)
VVPTQGNFAPFFRAVRRVTVLVGVCCNRPMENEEARLEDVGSGLAPATPGWFVVNAGEAAWVRNEAFGGRCVFESSDRVLQERPDLEPQYFTETGFTLAVLEPGKPSGMYHAESSQEDFLVLSGTCLLLIEDHERPLKAWDFVHCPAGTRHTFVGTGDQPCVIFMVGARAEDGTIVYPRSETAREHGAGVETETPSPAEAYAPFPRWRLGRHDRWAELPWA